MNELKEIRLEPCCECSYGQEDCGKRSDSLCRKDIENILSKLADVPDEKLVEKVSLEMAKNDGTTFPEAWIGTAKTAMKVLAPIYAARIEKANRKLEESEASVKQCRKSITNLRTQIQKLEGKLAEYVTPAEAREAIEKARQEERKSIQDLYQTKSGDIVIPAPLAMKAERDRIIDLLQDLLEVSAKAPPEAIPVKLKYILEGLKADHPEILRELEK